MITGRRKVGKVGWIEREATEATSDSFGMKVHQQAGGDARWTEIADGPRLVNGQKSLGSPYLDDELGADYEVHPLEQSSNLPDLPSSCSILLARSAPAASCELLTAMGFEPASKG